MLQPRDMRRNTRRDIICVCVRVCVIIITSSTPCRRRKNTENAKKRERDVITHAHCLVASASCVNVLGNISEMELRARILPPAVVLASNEHSFIGRHCSVECLALTSSALLRPASVGHSVGHVKRDAVVTQPERDKRRKCERPHDPQTSREHLTAAP